MADNKLIVAAAGSGKTTWIVNEALKEKEKRILITTYTVANGEEIKKKVIELNGCIPPNVTIQTWFSFLLQHGVKPYQGSIWKKKIKGMLLVNQPVYKFTNEDVKVQFKENTEFEQHYFTKSQKIYSDKIAKFVLRCNKKTGGEVIDRLSRIYPKVYIDELQDMAGYDLEIAELLLNCSTEVNMVCDPRQATFSTNNLPKYKKFKKSGIVDFFEQDSIPIEIDSESLNINYRCHSQIRELSDLLFPDYQAVESGKQIKTDHDGIFIIKPNKVEEYLSTYPILQLRDSIKQTGISDKYPVMNFGESKGLTFNRILIYPTKPILKWLHDPNKELAPTTRCKLYVALTRAKYSVGIVADCTSKNDLIQNYGLPEEGEQLSLFGI